MTLGERLLEYRTNLKMSQDALAEKLNVTRQTISKWETDQSTPEFNKILPLCELFGITTDELIKGEKVDAKDERQKSSEEEEKNNYIEKRNKQKAVVVSVAVFLYIIGTFCPPFIIEGLGEDDIKGVIALVMFWTIATVMLIYFFLSHPKVKDIEETKEKKVNNSADNFSKVIERRILEIITLLFLIIYIIVSFSTMAWYITWILWIVLPIVHAIVKIIFDIRRRKDEE